MNTVGAMIMKQIENNLEMFKKYLPLIESNFDKLNSSYDKCSAAHLSKLCKEAIHNNDKYPSDKLYRWLGFLEGILANSDIITFNETFQSDLSDSTIFLNDKEEKVSKILFNRYLSLIKEHHLTFDSKSSIKFLELKKICEENIKNTAHYSFDNLSNLLGFVQGVLAINGIISVDQERDLTRPLLHSLHKNKIPTFE